MNEAPEDKRPNVYLNEAASVISIGYKLNYAPIQSLLKSRSAYMLERDYTNRHLDEASHLIARFLEERVFRAIGFDSEAGFYHKVGKDPKRFEADISHKHIAVACGLGKYDPERGWVMNKERCYDYIFGILKSKQCGMCIKACPVGLNK